MSTENCNTFDHTSPTDTYSGFLETAAELEATKEDICAFIETTVAHANANGVVVAMSGGIDSTLTAALAVEALGSDRVMALGLPYSKTDGRHMSDARTIADGLGIGFRQVQLRPLVDTFENTVAATIETENDTDAIGNVIARVRMLCAYYTANAQSRLVCGTANRSELLLGYFTKYGDGGTDFNPLGDLYKAEVRSLARHIGLPRRIIEKDPTAGLQAGQTDEADLGASYDVIDPFLRRIVDHGVSVEDAADLLTIETETAMQIASRYVDSVHKRDVPPTPGLGTGRDGYPSYALEIAAEVDQHQRERET